MFYEKGHSDLFQRSLSVKGVSKVTVIFSKVYEKGHSDLFSFLPLVGLRLRVFGAQPPSELD